MESIGMNRLRLLLLMSSPVEAGDLLEMLNRHEMDTQSYRVRAMSDFDAALESQQWDFVIAAHNPPIIDVYEALNSLKSYPSRLPLILYSPPVGEEIAASFILAGAQAFVLQGNISLLLEILDGDRRCLLPAMLRRVPDETSDHWRYSASVAADMVVFYWNIKENAIEWTSGAGEIFGAVQEDIPVTYEMFVTFIHPEDRSSFSSELENIMKDLDVQDRLDREIRIQRQDRSIRCLSFKSRVIRDSMGQPAKLLGGIVDITDRFQAQSLLKTSEVWYQKLFHCNPAVMYVCNMQDGTIIDVNEAFSPCLGYAREEVLSCRECEIGLWASLEERQALGKQLEVEKTGVIQDVTLVRKSGSTFSALGVFNLLENEGVPLMVATLIDFSELKQAAGQLTNSALRFRELAEELPQIIYEVDIRGTLLYANRVAYETLGYSHEDFDFGVNIFRYIAPQDRHLVKENFKKILNGNQDEPAHYQILKKDGSVLPVVAFSVPMHRNQEVVGVRGVLVPSNTMPKTSVADFQTSGESLLKVLELLKGKTGFLSVCAGCRRVRDSEGKWRHFDTIMEDCPEFNFSHSYCEDCTKHLYPKNFDNRKEFLSPTG